jgi:ActR/RegA family two-component response regulator
LVRRRDENGSAIRRLSVEAVPRWQSSASTSSSNRRDPEAAIVVGVRVLFVENDAVFARVVVQEFLAEHDVTIVATIADALRVLDEPFAAVLVDYDLDDGKGTVVVQALRRRGFGGRIVGVSSHQPGNTALVAAGAHGACSKMTFDEIGRHLGASEP